MKQRRVAVYLDLTNGEMVEWFNKVGYKVAKWHIVEKFEDRAAGRVVGFLVTAHGPFGRWCEERIKSFYNMEEVERRYKELIEESQRALI